MTAATLFDDLRACGVVLGVTDGRLTYDAPAGVMTPERLAMVKAHKGELLAALAPQAPSRTWRVDNCGRIILADGHIYAPTESRGLILTKHPTKRMLAPGTLEPQF